MAYAANQNAGGLETLTTLATGDLVIVGDVDDSNRAKAITKANLVADLADETQTLTNKTISGASNTISGLTIGSQVTGASTALTDTAAIAYVADTDASLMGVYIDEDNMASNSATKFPSQQSVKAYVDASGGSSPLTTKGDLYTYKAADTRLPVGTNGQVLIADSAEATGLKWGAAGTGDVSKVGTPATTQVGVWTGDGTIAGSGFLSYDGITLGVTGTVNSSALTASELVITDSSKNLVSAPVATYPSLTELTYVKGVTSAIQGQVDLKAPIASPTFTGTVSGITATMVGLGNVDNTSNATERAATATLTNKRITQRVSTEASSATPTINTDNVDAHSITALAAAITSFTTNLSGTPTNFQKLVIRIKDDGTARAITWGASFEARGVALPTTTVISKVLTVGFIYDTVSSKWGCVASAQEA